VKTVPIDHLPQAYREFYNSVSTRLPKSRLIIDPLRTLAYGTDASFYRLIPKMVIKAKTESEVALILKAAARCNVAVTFRAAGTSLSGQAVTDSVLILTGDNWRRYDILDDGRRIRLQPGIVGGKANQYLASYGRKIGPDPASINAAMIGGIAANNASGMCCGTAENSYKTVAGLRIIFQDGTLLDTADPKSRESFRHTHPELLDKIEELGQRVRKNTQLAQRIRHKFKIKNTTGYSLNALVDFEDPFDIITHLMIGSEGTLGFMSEIVYHTVVEHPHKASALIIFPGIKEACSATTILKQQPVAAVELMDRASLRSVENKTGMPGYLKTLSPEAAALLVETRASDADTLGRNIDAVTHAIKDIPLERPLEFTDNVDQYTMLWNIRKGLFPAVGAVRETGTTVIIEDVAFPIEKLAQATLELQEIMAKFEYHEAIIFGHALEGNLHFVFTQDFAPASEVERYRRFMHEVCIMVVERYGGSLKAEHGTGRNMAPYVEMEWGADAYALMKEIKAIFDPRNLLNPGVILNSNPQVHVENLKPLPATREIVDKCIECGFCEPVCPSKNLTLTPRQRITVQREISRLKGEARDPDRLKSLSRDYLYQGDKTCATDGLCEVACPVDINTGELTKALRHMEVENTVIEKRARWVADHFGTVTRATRAGLKAADTTHTLLGSAAMTSLAHKAREVSGERLPLWNRYMPRAEDAPKCKTTASVQASQVVYFPSCIARTMGPAKGDPDQVALTTVTKRILKKAGYGVIYPDNMDRLCCGMPFSSKGLKQPGDEKAAELEKALLEASRGGELPVLCDTSPCLHRMRQVMDPQLKLFEPVEFVHDFLMDRLLFQQTPDTISVHLTCSSQKMGLEKKLLAVAGACAREVIVPDGVGCCGFAGDRGFSVPELNASALANLKSALAGKCTVGYSNSRTCEIGLSLHSGIHYKSILYLVDRCTRPLT
jgi:D-lactate dehydrogenase